MFALVIAGLAAIVCMGVMETALRDGAKATSSATGSTSGGGMRGQDMAAARAESAALRSESAASRVEAAAARAEVAAQKSEQIFVKLQRE
jgi:hypothetical protein